MEGTESLEFSYAESINKQINEVCSQMLTQCSDSNWFTVGSKCISAAAICNLAISSENHAANQETKKVK